jgi:ribosomal protein L11 methyltransferase
LREKRPRYTCAVFCVPAAAADDAAGVLIAFGALGCEVRKMPAPRRSYRAKKAVQLHAYFRRLTPGVQRRIAAIMQGMTLDGATPLTTQVVDPGWATLWQTRFEPLPIGRRFVVVPPWHRAKHPERVRLVIRPGQAFGTGHHPSTLGTLNLMEDWCDKHRVARALDVGTGSGILAIAMHKLGVPQIVAIDIDTVALENARENAELNRIDRAIRFSMAPLGSIRGRFDLITANILSSVLIAMAPALTERLRSGGGLILSGILKREAAKVVSAFAPELRCVNTRIDKAWATLLMER